MSLFIRKLPWYVPYYSGTRCIIVPRFEQNEQLQRTPWVNGSASNENWIAPQWQLPLYGCITIFHAPHRFNLLISRTLKNFLFFFNRTLDGLALKVFYLQPIKCFRIFLTMIEVVFHF
jgi:hypothetical protein